MTLFKLNKEERPLALAFFLILVGLYTLIILQYSPLFLKGGNLGYWTIFSNNFRLSGYDSWTLITLSNFRVHFDTQRHPFLLSLLLPFYALNQGIMSITGHNAAVFIMAIIETFCALYALVFLYRTLRHVVELTRSDATLLTLLFFGLAHVVVPMLAPDHFTLSLCLLMFTLWRTGEHLKRGTEWKAWQWAVLFFITSGVTLTNGAKVLLAHWFTVGKRFFSPRRWLLTLMLPLTLLVGVWSVQYITVLAPQKAEVKKIEDAKRKKNPEAFDAHQSDRQRWMASTAGKPIAEISQLKLTDISSNRITALVHNFFGESFQLHRNHLLEDMSFTRPVIIEYRHAANYVVEAALVLLLAGGLWAGRRQRFLQLCAAWFAVDLTLHIVLGFALNEVYIMTQGWAFILPVAFAYLLRTGGKRRKYLLRPLFALLTLWLWVWNGTLLVSYLLIPMEQLVR